jgi:autotransporter passenger strand-loop-strand repeat protein
VKGTATDTTVNGGGTQAVEGTSFNATIASGGTLHRRKPFIS